MRAVASCFRLPPSKRGCSLIVADLRARATYEIDRYETSVSGERVGGIFAGTQNAGGGNTSAERLVRGASAGHEREIGGGNVACFCASPQVASGRLAIAVSKTRLGGADAQQHSR